MSNVLVIGTSKYTRGGITAVIKAQKTGSQWNKYNCKWIGYHVDRAGWIKVLYYCIAFVRYCLSLPFFQIVHLHFSMPTDAKRAYYFFKIAKLLGKKTIVHLHCGDQLPEIWSPRYEELFTRCDLALVLSPSIKRKVEEYIGSGHRIEVLYNPCPTINKITPYPKREKEILYAGTLNFNKGYADLIKAFSIVAKNIQNGKLFLQDMVKYKKHGNLLRTLALIRNVTFSVGFQENRRMLLLEGLLFCVLRVTKRASLWQSWMLGRMVYL